MAQAKARHPDWKNRFFNVGFIVDPDGKIILKHYKLSALLPVERSVSPHDVYDWWIEKYGRNLQAFWPVADTKIGRLGIMMAMEGNYPENGRGLAMNGAEVVFDDMAGPPRAGHSNSPCAPALRRGRRCAARSPGWLWFDAAHGREHRFVADTQIFNLFVDRREILFVFPRSASMKATIRRAELPKVAPPRLLLTTSSPDSSTRSNSAVHSFVEMPSLHV